MIPTVSVTCESFDQNGNPIAGARFEAKLDRTEVYDGFVVPEKVTAFADANGVCVLELWPNALGANASSYQIKAWNPDTGKRFLDTTAVVPNSDCRLEQIIVAEPYPAVDAAQQALIAAQGALAPVTAQAQAAAASALVAQDAEDGALAAETAAQASAAAAQASEQAAATSEASASSSASTATGAAQTATQAADDAEAARDAAQAAATTSTAQATAAGESAHAAGLSANLAALSEGAAAGSESAAQGHATAAAASANTAQAQATAAQQAKTDAQAAASTAQAAAAQAEDSADAAAGQAGLAISASNDASGYASTAGTHAATATTKAGEASTSASLATTKASEAATSAAAAAADRVQTGLDAQATAADRAQVATDASNSSANAATANLKAGEAAGSASQAISLYGNLTAVQTAVAQAAAQASLAAGYAASASSVVQQDLSGVNAAALHRSPNAVTALFVYDTSKDSDGGAWTEKCQHTSWYNEPVMGKWLGAHKSEKGARYANPVLGDELVSNGTFASGIAGWTSGDGAPVSWVNGKLRITSVTGGSQTASQVVNVTAGKLYKINVGSIQGFDANGNKDNRARVEISLATGSLSIVFTTSIGTRLESSSEPQTTIFIPSVNTTLYVTPGVASNAAWAPAGNYAEFDDISVREIVSVTATSGDYYQNSSNGAFYKYSKNALTYTEELGTGGAQWFPRMWIQGANSIVASTSYPVSTKYGSVKMWDVVDNGTSGVHGVYVSQNGFGPDETTWPGAPNATFSCIIKRGTSKYIVLRQYSSTPYCEAKFNLDTLEYTKSSNYASIENLGSGLYRVSISHTYIGGGQQNWRIFAADANGIIEYSGSGTVAFSFSALQLEDGIAPTAYDANLGDKQVFRGNKREFPKLSAIVAESSNVTIYDLTESGRPMWKRILRGGLASAVESCLWTYGSAGAYEYNFALDSNTKRSTATDSYGLALYPFKASGVNPITNLIPVSAVIGTWSGAWLIHPTRSVSINMGTGSNRLIFLNEKFLGIGHAYTGQPSYALFADPFTMTASSAAIGTINAYSDYLKYPDFVRLIDPAGRQFKDQIAFFKSAAIQVAKQNFNNFRKGIAATITDTYNTGHMTGDIRRTYLSDNVVESVGPSTELLAGAWVNGVIPFDSFSDSTGGFTATKSVSGAQQQAYVGNFQITQGKLYYVEIVVSANTFSSGVHFDFSTTTTVRSNQLYAPAGASVVRGYMIPTSTQSSARLRFVTVSAVLGSITVDSATVKEIGVYDRSYKAQGANITGTLTKTEVATAAQLVAYSGFSAANYIRENWSADLDFGTGEWSVGAWVNVPVILPVASFPVIGPELVTNGDFSNGTTGWAAGNSTLSVVDGRLRVTSNGVSSNAVQIAPTVAGSWYEMTVSFGGGTAPQEAVRVGISPDNTAYAVFTADGTYSFRFFSTTTTTYITLKAGDTVGLFAEFDNISIRQVLPSIVAERSHSSGAKLHLGVGADGKLTATAFDGTTTRTVTTTAAYNTGTWLKAEADYTTDGTLSISVNGVEVAATRGNPLLTLNNSNAVLTIGNSFNLDAPFPGSIALLKLSATVPTAEQAVWMYEQEKQMFREGAQVCLPDAGAIAGLAYDEATDKWIAVSAANESEWSGLVRTSVTPVPAGSYSRVTAGGGVQMLARTTTNPGVDITIPAYGLREELVKRAEAAARLNAQLATFDYVGGFTASTTTGNTAITSVAGLTYPTSYIGARVSGAGIPANTTIVAVSGTTIYLSAAATATATGVQISFVDYVLPVGYEAKEVSLAGAAQREGATAQFTRLFDGFKETIRFGTAPSNTALVQIQAARSAA